MTYKKHALLLVHRPTLDESTTKKEEKRKKSIVECVAINTLFKETGIDFVKIITQRSFCLHFKVRVHTPPNNDYKPASSVVET